MKALNCGNAEEALHRLENISGTGAIYFRALAFASLKKAGEAAGEYEKLYEMHKSQFDEDRFVEMIEIAGVADTRPEIIEEVLSANPGNARIRNTAISVLIMRRNLDRAEKLIEEGLASMPSMRPDFDLISQAGILSSIRGNHAETARYLGIIRTVSAQWGRAALSPSIAIALASSYHELGPAQRRSGGFTQDVLGIRNARAARPGAQGGAEGHSRGSQDPPHGDRVSPIWLLFHLRP
ncbi:MAG: hypothetical protein MZV49_13230 [Rhodopseudomonas palustris]|nr:hypothetical protein [Rhodopseudomonas palustris]